MTVAIDKGQYRFDPLVFEESNGVPRETACKQALQARHALYKTAKLQGFEAKMWTLRGQLRQYKSWGIPCGTVRNVYYLDIR